MFSPNDRWLTKNVEAEKESEKGDQSSSSVQTPPIAAEEPSWSRKDDKEMDEMLGMGDHAPPLASSPVHRVTNDNLLSIASQQPEYFDDEEDVSTLANDTVANETFFKDNRMSPPRKVNRDGSSNQIFPDLQTPEANSKPKSMFGKSSSPTNTAPESPEKGAENDALYYKDFEEGNRFSKRFWKVVMVAACLGSFLIAAVIVLGMNYYDIREEKGASAAGVPRGSSSSDLQSSSGGASDNGSEFEFDIRTGAPTESTPVPSTAPSLSAAPSLSNAPTGTPSVTPSDFPSLVPSVATPSPTTMEPTMAPTGALSTGPTRTALPTGQPTTMIPLPTTEPSLPPTGQPTTTAPTVMDTPEPTGSPTTSEPTMAPTTPEPTMAPTTLSPTESMSEALIETLINAPNMPLDTMIDIEARDESSNAYQVVQWLAKDPNLSSYSDQVILQRFALSCLYKGLTKDMDTNPMETTWMTYTDFCEWTVSSETLCNGNGLASSIHLENFELEGEFGPEIALLRDSLTHLVVTNNAIYGSIPTEFGLLTQLERLRTHNNNMVGSLPTELGNMERLLSMRLGRNQHSGTIPVELENLQQLETLHLPRNQLVGQLPEALTNMDSLVTLSLKNNNLTGEIPEDFSKMRSLENLELQFNDFSGEIKKKDFCKLGLFVVDCTELECKCCEEENCCVDCDGRPF
ncbi:unnamed protein product [Cylindrotheca closterium]|uniref:L domain-like protein n=1 Tax=Cylindrotheca closterium TaxID=2856 RepID=A0AAD2PUJ0_9STRA|nr:unnamed protein product [Cylindrotheca closterium]